jgi:hypothetical protein
MADTVLVKYEADVSDLDKSLNNAIKKNEQLDKSAEKTSQDMSKNYEKASNDIVGSFKNIAAAAGLAFSVDRLITFGKEAVRVAAQAEGIERAFAKLNSPNLLANLRRATRGTVDDLTLMQQAVRANNFQVPLQKLASFFEFATKRSIETGESVDYLVQSIVDGIGRKSTLVLDNLGISASQLQEEIKRTGDFGEAAANIIEQSLEQTGEVADTTTVKIARLSATWANFTKEVGDSLIAIGDFVVLMDDVQGVSQQATQELEDYADRASTAGIAISQLAMARNEEIGLIERYRILLFGLTDAQREEIENSKIMTGLSEEAFVTLSELTGLYAKLDQEEAKRIQNLFEINRQIKALQQERLGANTTLERTAEINAELVRLGQQRIALLGGETEAMKRAREAAEEAAKAFQKLIAPDEELGFEKIEEEIAALLNTNVNIRQDGSARIQAILDEELRATLEGLDEEMKARELLEEQKEEQHERNLRRLQQEREAAFQVLDGIVQLGVTIGQIQQNALNQQLQNLEERYNQGKITREQFENEERDIRRKSAESQKALAIFQAVVGTAASVTQALGNVPPPASYILAGISAALGAAQIAVIASEPIPQFAEGVIGLQGEGTETSDSIHARLSKGESVMTASETRKHRGVLEAIRNNTLENYIYQNEVAPIVESIMKGGFAGLGASYALNERFNDKNLLRGTDRLRESNKDGFIYLGDRLERALMRKSKSRYV